MSEPSSLRDRIQKLTSQFVQQIEQAIATQKPLPWRRPWVSLSPTNGEGRAYRGLNQLLLSCSGFSDPRWYTMHKANELGGKVRKGEKGTQVYFWKILSAGPSATEEPETSDSAEAAEQRRFVLRCYYVWNYGQIEWADKQPPTFAKLRVVDPDGDARRMIESLNAYGVLTHQASRACYNPSLDAIFMPPRECFESDAKYAAVLAHEVVHSTGHPSRLNRDLSGRFGDQRYAMEELVAELGSAFVCAHHGMQSGDLDDHHASYLKHWLEVLKKDPYALFTVARLAQAASDEIVGAKVEERVAA